MADNDNLRNNGDKPNAAHGGGMGGDTRDWDFIDSLEDELEEEEEEGNGKEARMNKQTAQTERYESIEKALEALRAEGYQQVRFDISSTSNGQLGIERIMVSIDDYLAGEYVDATGQEMIICDLDDREFMAERMGDNGVWLMPANVYDELGMKKRVYWITR
ncbi:MAG: hypothetical protein KKB90_11470 [Actinobacteria bacterium]|nr:hypothetical protein [Actinomycetota bacterium]MCG2820258.1 hypothetical protein [Actinomycetes bacterium]MBU4219564.1 hypothetical protein [Actinomycetota bacterium]MBU4358132.1 hypothetical protein [Actinomycetota bacterium]MBU4392354.1 hypothetical protein [Actinomycetota bacterium]